MKKNSLLFVALLSIIALSSCEKDKLPEVHGDYENGVYIVNEGQFGHGNASVSFLNDDASTVSNTVFNSVNTQDLGDQAQSIAFTDENAYIVVTGSNKIEVADKNTMEKVVTLASHLSNPRYMQAVDNNIAYVSCWGDTSDDSDDYIAVINTSNNTYDSQIAVPLGPEKMIANDDFLFIAHQGAWGTNNKVTVLDLNARQITDTITVGDRPNSMLINGDYLWVLCSGEPAWSGAETAGELYKIDINNNFDIVQTLTFGASQHPQFLSIDGDNIYYYLKEGAQDGKIYQFDSNTVSALPASEYMTYASAYNMEINDGKLYISDAKDFQQEGEVIIYDINTKAELSRKTVGIIPGDFGFNLQ
jgi:hypothetical protein